jgi:hypothetical protein
MSTRAVIAKQTPYGWEGIYNHSDGYPTGLGRELWRTVRTVDSLERFLEDVIDAHPGGWSHFIPSIPRDLLDDYAASGYSAEFFARHVVRECYCHTARYVERDGSCATDSPHYRPGAPSGRITYDPTADGAGDLEWAYCFGPGSLTVFQALPSDVRRIGDGYQVASGDVYQLRPHAWQVIGVYSLRSSEPAWGVVECGGPPSYQRCSHLASVHLEGSERERVRSDPHLSKLSMRDYVRSNRES